MVLKNISELLPDEPIPPPLYEEIQFNNAVRDSTVFGVLVVVLLVFSHFLLTRYRRRDPPHSAPHRIRGVPGLLPPASADDDEALVDTIAMWVCIFSLSIGLGAVLLLPLSILSNEALARYRNSPYLGWISRSLIQGLWNMVFLFSNVALFVGLPFAYLFTEAEGFPGSRKGLRSRMVETVVVLVLAVVLVLGVSFMLAFILGYCQQDTLQQTIDVYLPFLYSIVSCLGVLFLLICTPVGLGRLFSALKGLIRGGSGHQHFLMHPPAPGGGGDEGGRGALPPSVLEDLHAVTMEEQALARELQIICPKEDLYKSASNTYAQQRRHSLSSSPQRCRQNSAKRQSSLEAQLEGLSVPLRAPTRLLSGGGCNGWSSSLLGGHNTLSEKALRRVEGSSYSDKETKLLSSSQMNLESKPVPERDRSHYTTLAGRNGGCIISKNGGAVINRNDDAVNSNNEPCGKRNGLSKHLHNGVDSSPEYFDECELPSSLLSLSHSPSPHHHYHRNSPSLPASCSSSNCTNAPPSTQSSSLSTGLVKWAGVLNYPHPLHSHRPPTSIPSSYPPSKFQSSHCIGDTLVSREEARCCMEVRPSQLPKPLRKSLPAGFSEEGSPADGGNNAVLQRRNEELLQRWRAAHAARIHLEALSQQGLLRRCLVYPLGVLVLVMVTAVVVLIVFVNTLQLIAGFKDLPLVTPSSEDGGAEEGYGEADAGVMLGKRAVLVWLLGPLGAVVEVLLILYLVAASFVGCYSLTPMRELLPRPGDTPMVHLIYNCSLLLVLASALPLLATTLGLTNFDLLGDYGRVSWLGNMRIVLLYNVLFVAAAVWCLVQQFTAAVRGEIYDRLGVVGAALLRRCRLPLPRGAWEKWFMAGVRGLRTPTDPPSLADEGNGGATSICAGVRDQPSPNDDTPTPVDDEGGGAEPPPNEMEGVKQE